MYLELSNRDYVPDGAGGFRRAGELSQLSEALFRLTCRRGAFPFLPTLGSRLYTLGREKRSGYEAAVRQYATEALEPIGLRVVGAAVTPADGGGMRVHLTLQSGSTHWEVTL